MHRRRPLVRLATAPAAAAPRLKPTSEPSLTVMTRNVYLGGDFSRPLTAAQAATAAGADAAGVLTAFMRANAELFRMVQRTDFPARSELLAGEIARTDPDVVGLQEVALWRTGALELPPDADFGRANATTVAYDFLRILLDDLAELGEPYEVVEAQVEADVEGPAVTQDVRLTMRDVLLRRVGSAATVGASGSKQYAAGLDVPIGPGYRFVRGYNWADVTVAGTTVRVINTHLESVFSYLAAQQAGELLAGPAATQLPVVILCDCNSDPLDGSRKTLPTGGLDVPHWTAYRLLVGAGRFQDAWLQVAPARRGYTSGLSETVDDTPGKAKRMFDHRIDLVLTRGLPDALSATVTGTNPRYRTAAKLWPSDHAGVVVRLALPGE